MLQVVYFSKKDNELQIAASNAITLLNYANYSFSYLDLSKIKIPEANLLNSNFYYTNLEDSDFTNCKLGFSNFIGANLQNIIVSGASFFEKPCLTDAPQMK